MNEQIDSLPGTDLMEPLYIRLSNQLRTEINEGKYPKGSQLPTEQELCERYSLSRVTVRNAIRVLTEERLLERRQGKGTFVINDKFRHEFINAVSLSFSDMCRQMNKKPGSKVIRSIITKPSSTDHKELRLAENEHVIVIERIRFADDMPVALEVRRFPERYDFLLQEDLNNQSMHQLLSEKYEKTFEHGHNTIEVVFASYEMAKYLHLPEGYPLISIVATYHELNGTPGFRFFQYIVGDKFKIIIR